MGVGLPIHAFFYNLLHLRYVFLGCVVPSASELLKNSKLLLMPVFGVRLLAKFDLIVSNNFFHTLEKFLGNDIRHYIKLVSNNWKTRIIGVGSNL